MAAGPTCVLPKNEVLKTAPFPQDPINALSFGIHLYLNCPLLSYLEELRFTEIAFEMASKDVGLKPWLCVHVGFCVGALSH